MFRVASRNDGDDLSDGLRGLGSGPLFSEGMPYGVRLDKDHLRAIVGTLAEEPDDLEPALVGLFQANNMAIATGLDRAAAEYGTGDAARRFWGNQRDLFSPAITSAGEATAWLLEAGHGGARADEAARATQAELVARALSTASSLPFIPDIPAETAKWFVDQGRSAAIDAVESTPATATGRFSAARAAQRPRRSGPAPVNSSRTWSTATPVARSTDVGSRPQTAASGSAAAVVSGEVSGSGGDGEVQPEPMAAATTSVASQARERRVGTGRCRTTLIAHFPRTTRTC